MLSWALLPVLCGRCLPRTPEPFQCSMSLQPHMGGPTPLPMPMFMTHTANSSGQSLCSPAIQCQALCSLRMEARRDSSSLTWVHADANMFWNPSKVQTRTVGTSTQRRSELGCFIKLCKAESSKHHCALRYSFENVKSLLCLGFLS